MSHHAAELERSGGKASGKAQAKRKAKGAADKRTQSDTHNTRPSAGAAAAAVTRNAHSEPKAPAPGGHTSGNSDADARAAAARPRAAPRCRRHGCCSTCWGAVMRAGPIRTCRPMPPETALRHPRLTPCRADLAAAHLQGVVVAPRFVAGLRMHCDGARRRRAPRAAP